MSGVLKNSLKGRLIKTRCHFTWNLSNKDVDIEKVQDRLYEQIQFLPAVHKYRMYNLMAFTNYLKEDYEGSIAYLEKAEEQISKIESDNTEARKTIIYANYAWIFYHKNQVIKGFKYAKKVQEIYKVFECPDKQNVLLFEAYSEEGFSLLTFHGRHNERAKDCFQRALELDPENVELNSSYAISVYRLEGFNCLKTPLDESFLLLQKAAKLNPKDTVIKVLLGLKYQDINESKKGLVLIEEALRETPEFPYLLRYVAKFYRREGMTDEAILVLSEATRINPTSSHLHHQLSMCYKKKIMALKDCAKLAKLQFQPTDNLTEEISDTVSRAIFHLEMAVKYKKTFVVAYIALAGMYGRKNQYEKAEEIFHKILEMDNVTHEEKQELHLVWAQHELCRRHCQTEAIRHFKEVIKMKSLTVFRKFAMEHCERIAKEMISKNPREKAGFELLEFIYQDDQENITEKVQQPRHSE
ncbi:interferon-induced protein with tetratricopeptide repeats 5-like [Phyllobates terribilis]|uniref:interferon-induced protein with tetratricopeptide repeats 5-like n=1 Tax=Phyllobates terribilis TaxID=111132 RepID=UPI003CCAEFB0